MRLGVILAALLGLALAVWLITAVGVRAIVAALLHIGWGGFLVLCLSGVTLFGALGAAWFSLVPGRGRTGFADFVWARAVREFAGELLPFSQLGGIVFGARALTLRGVAGSVALASSIVDVTVEMIAQILFVLSGLFLLLTVARLAPANAALTRSVAIGAGAATFAAVLFFLFQRQGIATLARWSVRLFPRAGAWLGDLHQGLADIHASPARLALSLLIHSSGWVGTALWAWLALHLIGRHVSFAFVFTIEAILCAIRSVAILVPGAVGVQEVSYALLGPLFGLAPPAAIALSLLKRARDVAIGVPVLVVWQIAESGHAWKNEDSSAQRLARKRVS